ncbi:MAG: uracil-DNA glycosylase [Candidatus Cloacimonadota bacterium]|nr:MAG: uracil-DNA glycosylase [Candidatus Cloacimonadota bacterium]
MLFKTAKQYLELLQYSGIKEIFKTPEENETVFDAEPENYSIEELREKYKNCEKCPLCKGRICFVYGDGNADADLMLIGEGPGYHENQTGHAFVGPAGQLLTKMLAAIKIDRKDVYIANIVKCRPPGNRDPRPEEKKACLPYLLEQIDLIKPKVLLLLGKVAANTLLNTDLKMYQLRENTHVFRGITTFVSYHPSALLRHVEWKKPAWIDLQKLQKYYESL